MSEYLLFGFMSVAIIVGILISVAIILSILLGIAHFIKIAQDEKGK